MLFAWFVAWFVPWFVAWFVAWFVEVFVISPSRASLSFQMNPTLPLPRFLRREFKRSDWQLGALAQRAPLPPLFLAIELLVSFLLVWFHFSSVSLLLCHVSLFIPPK